MTDINEQHQQAVIKINRAIDELPVLPSAVAQLIALSITDEQYFEKVKK